MSVTLSQVLELLGRLDDESQGFDTPRERFRRFLTESIVDMPSARGLIEEGQHLIGEQEHRALQDALVAFGRFLGFETVFGTYQRRGAAAKYDGVWRSRRRLNIVIEVRSNPAPRSDFEDLSRLRSTLATDTGLDADTPLMGLCIVTPIVAGRGRLQESLLADHRHDWRLASVRSLLWLAEMHGSGRLQHDEIVKLMTSSADIDFVVELLARFHAGSPERDVVSSAPSSRVEAPQFWAATVERSEAASFHKMIESVAGTRHVLGVSELGPSTGAARPGDWICFVAPGTGVIGKAQVSAADADAHLLRRSDRFARLYGLKDVEIYHAPIVPAQEFEQSLVGAQERSGIPGPVLVPVSMHQFRNLTTMPAGRRSENHEGHVDGVNHKEHKDHEGHEGHKGHEGPENKAETGKQEEKKDKRGIIEKASRSRG
jgi:hypothetical protein